MVERVALRDLRQKRERQATSQEQHSKSITDVLSKVRRD